MRTPWCVHAVQFSYTMHSSHFYLVSELVAAKATGATVNGKLIALRSLAMRRRQQQPISNVGLCMSSPLSYPINTDLVGAKSCTKTHARMLTCARS